MNPFRGNGLPWLRPSPAGPGGGFTHDGMPLMNDTTAPLSFEQALAALDRTVRELEDGRLGLDDALSRYETGVGLIKNCYNQLRQAERRILQLTGADADGQPVLTPFRHEATALARPDARRTRPQGDRRSNDASCLPLAPALRGRVWGQCRTERRGRKWR